MDILKKLLMINFYRDLNFCAGNLIDRNSMGVQAGQQVCLQNYVV